MCTTQIKLFYSDASKGSLEKRVNDFCKDVIVKDVKFNYSETKDSSATVIMVIYEVIN